MLVVTGLVMISVVTGDKSVCERVKILREVPGVVLVWDVLAVSRTTFGPVVEAARGIGVVGTTVCMVAVLAVSGTTFGRVVPLIAVLTLPANI